jgi:hypothetical protein
MLLGCREWLYAAGIHGDGISRSVDKARGIARGITSWVNRVH